MSTLNEELGKVESQITTKEAEATALDEELARRSDVIDKAWDSATPKGGLVESVALDTEDGNDIVVTLAGGIKFDALPAQQQAALTAMGITPEGNTLVLKDMPPTTYEDAGKAQLDIVINTLAGLKGEVVDEGADGDLEPGADTKEASPETIKAVEELNEQRVGVHLVLVRVRRLCPQHRLLLHERVRRLHVHPLPHLVLHVQRNDLWAGRHYVSWILSNTGLQSGVLNTDSVSVTVNAGTTGTYV